MAGTSSAKTRFALLPGHDEKENRFQLVRKGPQMLAAFSVRLSEKGGRRTPLLPRQFSRCHLLPPTLALRQQRLADLLELLQRRLVGSRKPQVQRFERADDRRADHHPREPFVIGGHHVPWRQRRGSMTDQVLIGGHVSGPQRALGNVGHGKSPV